MTPERWQQIKIALHEAMQLDPEPRMAYLERIGGEDPGVREELDSLLAANDQARSTFMSGPAAAALSPEGALRDPMLGRRLGPYQIIEEIGTGGMGEVYRAFRADEAYRQSVAIKLVRAGQGSSFVLSRFKAERQILASLDHPNITRLLDGGTTEEGVPYLVMELIDGQPIHQYCEQRQLDTNQRLHLFIDVCGAVHYAHQRLIIHRDLKPSNILVTPQGAPKLLDFGIAKILEPSILPEPGLATASVVRLFTPAYASPEQIKGEAITTACDVYALGVVLCEVLTGRNPRAVAAAERGTIFRPSTVACADSPARSTRAAQHMLRKRFAGDLDNIVLMATRPEPQRRYASAEQLATDLQRHLDHLPIIARNDTFRYRASSFVARHTAAVIASVLVAVALLSAVAVTLHAARVAQVERVRSERRFNDARRLANSLMREIYDSIKDLPGATPARKLLVSKALEYLDGLSRDAAGDWSLERELATAYALVGDVQGNPYYANLGDPRGALDSYRKGLAIRQRLAAATPNDAGLIRALSGSYNQIGAALTGLGDFTGALDGFRSALDALERVDAGSTDPLVLDQFAGAHYYVARAAVRTGQLDLAADAIRNATAIRDTIVAADPKQARDVRTHQAGDHALAAEILEHKSLYAAAAQQQRTAVAIMHALSDENPNNVTIQSFLGSGQEYLGYLQAKLGDERDALQSYRQAAQASEAVLRADPQNAFSRARVGNAYRLIGSLEAQQGALPPGLADLKRALATLEPLDKTNSASADLRAQMAETYSELGHAYEAQLRADKDLARRRQDLRAACGWYRKSVDTWLDLRQRNSLDAAEQKLPDAAEQALADCSARLQLKTPGPRIGGTTPIVAN
jgi:non-specific serine/threonine protein kinase/serine/threonine-protein kinase